MIKNLKYLFDKSLEGGFLSAEEGIALFSQASTTDLMYVANELKQKYILSNKVTWIIDRNVNTTNVCVANCKFCNFFRPPGHPEGYITDIETYKRKIEETFKYGGEQLLLQGGHHPDLGLSFYVDLFSQLKALYPTLKLHSLGPPEIVHIAQLEKMSYKDVLLALKAGGLDSLPGAGAEILNDRVRRLISNGKCSAQEWIDVMLEAHDIGLTTSATMMFGHIETIEERFEHFIKIRDIQDRKRDGVKGFIAFIPWTFQDDNTILNKVKKVSNQTSGDEYLRMIAISRIMLPNIKNIQASWLTVGKHIAQLSLYGGANDFGSIMIEENVVSAAGAPHRFTSNQIQETIKEAGFVPQLRNQEYEYRELPKDIEQQVIRY